jgi:hypothetical protein
LATLLEATLRVVCHIVKVSVLNPISGEILVKFTHACLPPPHPFTIIFAGLTLDRPSCGFVKKLTCAFFFTDILARQKNIKKGISNKLVPVFEVGELSTIY